MLNNIIALFIALFVSGDLKSQETRIKIVVIDSGISKEQSQAPYMCEYGVKSFYNDGGIGRNPHGQNIVSIISKSVNPKTHCIISWKVYDLVSSPEVDDFVARAMIRSSEDEKVMFINQSLGGGVFKEDELEATLRVIRRGGVITVSAGNESLYLSKDSCNMYPACYKKFIKNENFKVVGSTTKSRNGLEYTNFGPIITDWVEGNGGTPLMQGTSQASANLMGRILLTK